VTHKKSHVISINILFKDQSNLFCIK